MSKPDRHVLAARDVGLRKPLSPGWHAELPAAFHRHDIYREYPDGSRLYAGNLTIEAVEAWQGAARPRKAGAEAQRDSQRRVGRGRDRR